jgi:hypothetical protein
VGPYISGGRGRGRRAGGRRGGCKPCTAPIDSAASASVRSIPIGRLSLSAFARPQPRPVLKLLCGFKTAGAGCGAPSDQETPVSIHAVVSIDDTARLPAWAAARPCANGARVAASLYSVTTSRIAAMIFCGSGSQTCSRTGEYGAGVKGGVTRLIGPSRYHTAMSATCAAISAPSPP